MSNPSGDLTNRQNNVLLSLLQAGLFFRSELAGRRRNLALFVILTVGVSLVDFLCPLLCQRIIDVAIPQKSVELTLVYSLLIAAGMLTAYGLNVVVVRCAVRLKEEAVFETRRKLMRQILSKDPVFFHHFNAGDILTRFANDLYIIGEYFYEHLLFSLIYLIMALVFIVWLFALNVLMAFCISIFYIVHVGVSLVTYRSIVQSARIAQDKNSEQNEVILDIVRGAAEIRVYQQESAFLERFDTKGRSYCEAQTRALYLREGVWTALDRLSRVSIAVPIITGAFLLCFAATDITIGLIVAFVQVMVSCSRYVYYIAYSSLRGSSIAASIDRVDELMSCCPERQGTAVSIDQAPDSSDIEVREVAFSYATGRAIFEQLNLSIKGGERVAIMAPSGFGKTTFARLLMGLVQPSSGSVLFGGRDTRSYPRPFYLTFFSYVSQDAHIFRLSVRDNIEMGWHARSERALQGLLRQLHIETLIEALPNRIDTVLNVEGLALSKGQQQRIVLARSLIREPEVLVLDEFTSGLDEATEQQILDDLLSLMTDRTIICITHSPKVAARMDRTIRLDKAVNDPRGNRGSGP